MTTNYPGNRKTTRVTTESVVRENKPEKKIDKVVTGEVVVRKKSLSKRFRETFIGGEDARGVFNYVTFEVLAPAAKDMIVDAVTQAVERAIFGDARPRRGGFNRTGSNTSYVSYNKFSGSTRRDPRDDPRPQISREARRGHDFNEIVLATRAEGLQVIDRLYDLLDQYKTVSVADLYELVGITGEYTDDKWGWEDLRGSQVHRTKDGYILDLPRPTPL